MLIDKMLLFDKDVSNVTDSTTTLIIFKNKVEYNDVNYCIYECKRMLEDEWTWDDVIQAITNKFEIENIIDIYEFEMCGL